jgi:heparin binding hemagglutinin HbhA
MPTTTVPAQLSQDLRRTALGTGYAVVGATDLVVEQLREARVRAEKARTELEPSKLGERVQQAPTLAVTFALDAAGKVEGAYDDLATRGRELVGRIRRQKATQDLVAQGRSTLGRTRAAVTSVRRNADDTRSAAEQTVETAKREAEAATAETTATARKRTQRTATSARKTATTTRTKAAASRSAAKGATTSARKTANQAAKATEAAAAKVGD